MLLQNHGAWVLYLKIPNMVDFRIGAHPGWGGGSGGFSAGAHAVPFFGQRFYVRIDNGGLVLISLRF